MAIGQIPDFWEKHAPNETVKVVPLAAGDNSYKTVESQFKQTVPGVNILSVSHLVQNVLTIWIF